MKNFALLVTAMVMLLAGAITAVAAEKPAGEPYTVVTSQELKAMIDAVEPGLAVIDTRTNEEYQEAHIRGAISIPWARLENDRSLLDFPKESKVVFYCTGHT